MDLRSLRRNCRQTNWRRQSSSEVIRINQRLSSLFENCRGQATGVSLCSAKSIKANIKHQAGIASRILRHLSCIIFLCFVFYAQFLWIAGHHEIGSSCWMDTREKKAQRPSNKTGANFWRGGKRRKKKKNWSATASVRFVSSLHFCSSQNFLPHTSSHSCPRTFRSWEFDEF